MLLLLFQVAAALLQTRFLFLQGGLLRGDGGGLNAQRLTLGLLVFDDGWRGQGVRQFDAELKRPDVQEIAVLKPHALDALAVDIGPVDAVEVAQLPAVGAGREDAVQRRDTIDIQAEVAALIAADEGCRRRLRPARPGLAAVVQDCVCLLPQSPAFACFWVKWPLPCQRPRVPNRHWLNPVHRRSQAF